MCLWKRTELAANFLHKSDKLVFGWFFSLLNEQWWRERLPDGLIVEFRGKQVRGHRVAGLLLEEDFSSLWVVEVVRDVGLISCGRSEFCQGAKLLVWRSGSGYLLRRCPHGRRGSRQSTAHGESQNEETTRNKRSTAHHGWHEYGVMRECWHLSHAMWYAHQLWGVNTNFPIHSAIGALSFRRSLAELEDFGIARVSDQILWFFIEMVDLLRLFKVFQQHILVWLIFKLFDSSSNCFFAICVHLLNSGVWDAWDSKISTTTATGLPVLMLFALDFLESVTGSSSRLCCGFGTSVTRGNLGDWYTLHYNCSTVFMQTTFSVHIAGSVLETVFACDRVR